MQIKQALIDSRKEINVIDARLLLVQVLRCTKEFLLAHPDSELNADQANTFFSLVERRKNGEPLAYLTRIREFYDLEFEVSPAVLIPRSDTELLVDIALKFVPTKAPNLVTRSQDLTFQNIPRFEKHNIRILELGTGSGAISISLAKNSFDISITAIDISEESLQIAKSNAAKLLGSAHQSISFLQSDWYTAVTDQKFDLILTNPPYIAELDSHLSALKYEPMQALVSGSDGLDALRLIIGNASKHLNKDGWIFCEHGYDQAEKVRGLFKPWSNEILTFNDLAGIPRVTGGRLSEHQ